MEYRIDKIYLGEVELEKSKFYSHFFAVNSKEEFIEYLNKIKKENPKARHVCYAYKINGEIKFSDDGEPSGTAGKPLLGIIENKNLNNVGLLVIRYFGGTLLGAGRLLRTYVNSALEAVNKAEIFEVVDEKEYEVEVEYDVYDIFKNYLSKKQFNVKNTIFNDKIVMKYNTSLDFDEDISSLFLNKVLVKNIKVVKTEKRK